MYTERSCGEWWLLLILNLLCMECKILAQSVLPLTELDREMDTEIEAQEEALCGDYSRYESRIQ